MTPVLVEKKWMADSSNKCSGEWEEVTGLVGTSWWGSGCAADQERKSVSSSSSQPSSGNKVQGLLWPTLAESREWACAGLLWARTLQWHRWGRRAAAFSSCCLLSVLQRWVPALGFLLRGLFPCGRQPNFCFVSTYPKLTWKMEGWLSRSVGTYTLDRSVGYRCKAVRVAGLHPRLFWRCRCAQQNTGWTVVGTLHQQWTHIVLITSSLTGCKIQYRSQHPNRELRASAVRCVEDILQPGPVLFGFCRQIRREWQSCRATVESVLPQWSTQIARRSTKRPGMYF